MKTGPAQRVVGEGIRRRVWNAILNNIGFCRMESAQSFPLTLTAWVDVSWGYRFRTFNEDKAFSQVSVYLPAKMELRRQAK